MLKVLKRIGTKAPMSSRVDTAIQSKSNFDLEGSLIELMEVFDRTVEKDQFDKNLGYRSLKKHRSMVSPIFYVS